MLENKAWDYLNEAPAGKEREQVSALLAETLAIKRGETPRKIEKKKRTPVQRLLHIGMNLLFWLLVVALSAMIFTGIQAKKEGQIPSVFGYSFLQVETGSMVPTLPIGSYIIIQKTDAPEEIPVDTIVTFYFENGTVVTHRIIEVLDDPEIGRCYRTKGDNPQNDPDSELLTPDRVIGIVRHSIKLPSLWGGEG